MSFTDSQSGVHFVYDNQTGGFTPDIGLMPSASDPTNPTNASVYAAIAAKLQSYGLGNLFQFTGGKPSGVLWDQIVSRGITDPTEIQDLVEQNPDFQHRFSVMFAQRQLAAQGKPVQVMTPDQIRAYELQAQNTVMQYNLPPGLYDHPHAFDQYMLDGVTATQLDQSIREGYNRVVNTDPNIRLAFEQQYPGMGDQALAAFWTDPEHFDANHMKIARAAAVVGAAKTAGLDVSWDTGMQAAGYGMDETSGRALAGAVALKPLTNETIGETTDLTDDTLAKSALGLSGDAASQLEQRRRSRVADYTGGGGAANGQAGVTGLQEAR